MTQEDKYELLGAAAKAHMSLPNYISSKLGLTQPTAEKAIEKAKDIKK
jgi:hypothetical protein